jgi:uncharacterized protein YcnI
MKTMLSLLAAAALFVSAGGAHAMCGHDSAKLEQTVASTSTAVPSEEEAASTHETTVKKPVESNSEEMQAE